MPRELGLTDNARGRETTRAASAWAQTGPSAQRRFVREHLAAGLVTVASCGLLLVSCHREPARASALPVPTISTQTTLSLPMNEADLLPCTVADGRAAPAPHEALSPIAPRPAEQPRIEDGVHPVTSDDLVDTGLPPIGDTAANDLEIRLHAPSGRFRHQFMVRLRRASGVWLAETWHHVTMGPASEWALPKGCPKWKRSGDVLACRAVADREAARQLASQLRELGVWTMPDLRSLPEHVQTSDGRSLVVELADRTRARAYAAHNPHAQCGPEAREAARMLELVCEFAAVDCG